MRLLRRLFGITSIIHLSVFGCGAKYDILDHYQKTGYSFKESIENLFRETNTDYFMSTTKKKDYRHPKPELNTNMDKVYTYLKGRKNFKRSNRLCKS